MAALAYSLGVCSRPSSRRRPFRRGNRAFSIWAQWCAGNPDGRGRARGGYRSGRRHPADGDIRSSLSLGSAQARLAPVVALYGGWGYWRDLRICLRRLLQSRQPFATGMATPKSLDRHLRIGHRGHNCKWPCMADRSPGSGLIVAARDDRFHPSVEIGGDRALVRSGPRVKRTLAAIHRMRTSWTSDATLL